MPTILMRDGFRFFFYSSEGNEPIHIHVTKANGVGKIWLAPAQRTAYLHNFTKSEEKRIDEIVAINFELFKDKWNEHFSK